MKYEKRFELFQFILCIFLLFSTLLLSINPWLAALEHDYEYEHVNDQERNQAAMASQDENIDMESGSRGRSRQTFSHTIFAEYFTTEWCVYCPSASKMLNEVYKSNDYPFYYISMMLEDADSNTISQDAKDRAADFGISGYPTTEFEGGYIEVVGGQTDQTKYRDSIETCGARAASDIDLKLSASHNGGAKVDISVEIINNDGESYSGTLRVYIAEIESRYLDYDGNQSSYGFLDFAITKGVDVPSGQSLIETTTWDGAEITDGLGNNFGDIDPENIIVYATMSNGDRATAFERNAESCMALNLYFIDETAAAYLTDEPPVDDTIPLVRILSPEQDEEVTGTIKIEAEVTDDGTLATVEYQIDDDNVWTQMFIDEFHEYYRFWDTEYVAEGEHTITVRAVDLKYNQGEDSVIINVVNDQENPVILFKDIKEDQEINDVFRLTVEVTDDGAVKKVQYQVDDGDWTEMEFKGFNKYTSEIDTNSLSDGMHLITVEAEDTAGKTETDTITVQVKNQQDSTEPLSPIPGFDIGFILCALAIIVFYYTSPRRKKKKNR